jgi:hypothetical protein
VLCCAVLCCADKTQIQVRVSGVRMQRAAHYKVVRPTTGYTADKSYMVSCAPLMTCRVQGCVCCAVQGAMACVMLQKPADNMLQHTTLIYTPNSHQHTPRPFRL